MKRNSTLVLAVIVSSLVLCAAIAGNASADSLCKENVNPCPSGSTYLSGTEHHWVLKKKTTNTDTSSLGNVVCTEYTLAWVTRSVFGIPIPVSIPKFKKNVCTLGSTSCTTTVEGLPYSGGITASGGGNGVLTTPLRYHTNCGSALNCIFESPGATFSITGGLPAIMEGSEKMNLIMNEGFLCPSSMTMDVSLELSSTTPLFIESQP